MSDFTDTIETPEQEVAAMASSRARTLSSSRPERLATLLPRLYRAIVCAFRGHLTEQLLMHADYEIGQLEIVACSRCDVLEMRHTRAELDVFGI